MGKGINSRAKGKRGELELAEFLREHGYADARRGQQYSGTETSADILVTGISEDWHIECKRQETIQLLAWVKQALRDKGPGQAPVVMHRTSDHPWLATIMLDDFLKLLLVRSLPHAR